MGKAQAAASLLAQTVDAASSQPASALPLLALGLITSCVRSEGIGPAPGADASGAADAWCEVMRQVLEHSTQLAGQQAGSSSGGLSARLGRARLDAAAELLEALRGRLQPAAYISCLGTVITSSSGSRVRRRAMDLLASAVSQAPAASLEAMAAAALGMVDTVLLTARTAWQESEGAGVSVAQAALAALSVLATAYAPQRPKPFVTMLQPLLEVLRHPDALLRSSTGALVAAVAHAVGAQLVPMLPAVLPAILGMVRAVLDAAQPSVGDASPQPAAPVAADIPGLTEQAALELSAGLAAISAMVDTLGAFLAPHLPSLLDSLLYVTVVQVGIAASIIPAPPP